jgi:hypothetical protein
MALEEALGTCEIARGEVDLSKEKGILIITCIAYQYSP